MMKRWLVCSSVAGCMGGPVNTAPVPELPATEVWMRGTQAQEARLTNSDEAEIVANVVRGFYRPPRNQVRLIGAQPLANERSRWADSAIAGDINRAGSLVNAIGLSNVCVDFINDPCTWNRSGGSLRFSPAYGIARDSAVIYAQYTPIGGGDSGEIEFRMVRSGGGWHMASRRAVARMPAENAPARAAADSLLAVDRASGAANRSVVDALAAMFDDSVVMQVPGGFADGREAALDALRGNADNIRSLITWTPIRVGVSADLRHGFSFGYMTLARPDGSQVPLKYLAYWIKRGGEWKVLAYKRRPRPAGEVSLELLPPALPAVTQLLQPTGYSLQADLAAAEKAFSDQAQVIGIGPAFQRNGRPHDSMNMGGPGDTAFVIGSAAIGRSVGAGYPATGSPVHWASDYRAIVASSGDLGVTFGYIRPHQPPPAGQPPLYPFFTIWKRDPGGPWRYIAE